MPLRGQLAAVVVVGLRLRAVLGAQQPVFAVDRVAGLAAGADLDAMAMGRRKDNPSRLSGRSRG